MNKPSFILGTAQLAMPYGIANVSGKPSLEETLRMIECAIQNDILFFDTAQDYGDCETILGHCFRELGVTEKVHVISKVNSQSFSVVASSIKKMGIKSLFGLLWRGANPPFSFFERVKAEGLARHVGVSVYREEEVENALENEAIEMIQLPFNIFDQRALQRGWFEKAKRKKKQISVRSVFLQGLLLMDPHGLPEKMSFAKTPLQEYVSFCGRWRLSQREMALGFVLRHVPQASLVIGLENKGQLIENIKLFDGFQTRPLPQQIDFHGEGFQKELINPSLWS